ncbi:MAG: hypothetical protein KZQ58_12150 [gamma proteobacterium symbiont of Bathyaustriella thionipta]|nr:hypothetical protein [gamma proteobacterium symbiont of Bathyaustriella thionipta]
MDDFIVWLIIALFYAPLHYLGPILLLAMRTDEAQRRSAINKTILDCSLSMLVSFGLLVWLASDYLLLAMVLLLCSMFVPYIRVFLQSRRSEQS